MKKFVIFAFRKDPMCFMHVLLNALDFYSRGIECKIVIEGESVVLVKEMIESGNALFKKSLEADLVDCICRACSIKMGVLEYNESCGIKLKGEMSGHPSIAGYTELGYEIITL